MEISPCRSRDSPLLLRNSLAAVETKVLKRSLLGNAHVPYGEVNGTVGSRNVFGRLLFVGARTDPLRGPILEAPRSPEEPLPPPERPSESEGPEPRSERRSEASERRGRLRNPTLCKKLAPPQILHSCLAGSQCGELFDPTMPPRGACLCVSRLWPQLSHRSAAERPGALQREAVFNPEVPRG